MIKASRKGHVLEMATLLAKIPEVASRRITGIIDPTEAWERLNEHYRDKQLAVIAAIK